jgi:hypothetical protein
MSTPVGGTTKGQGGMPTWDEGDKRRAMKRWFTILIVVVVGIWLALIGYVLIIAPIVNADIKELTAGASLTLILAPILAAAAGVERMLESFFNVVEGGWKSMIAYLGRGLRWLKNAEIEVIDARQWLADVSTVYNQKMRELQIDPKLPVDSLTADLQARIAAADTLRAMAEQRLTDAEKTLSQVTASDGYRSAKAAASIVLGLMLGVIVAAVGQLQMFAMLGIDAVPARIDVFITGLIIGSGSYPVHSLVGILQQGKDTLDGVKGFFNRSAPQATATAQRVVTVQPPSAPGDRPVVQEAVIETTTAQTTEETPNP